MITDAHIVVIPAMQKQRDLSIVFEFVAYIRDMFINV